MFAAITIFCIFFWKFHLAGNFSRHYKDHYFENKFESHKIDSKIQFFYTVWWSFDEKFFIFSYTTIFFFFLQRFSWITTFRYNKQCKWKNGVISRKWQIRSFFSKEENCDIVQNDIVQAVIILICLQSIYKQIQNSEKKTCTCRKRTFAWEKYMLFYTQIFRGEYCMKRNVEN